MHIWNKLIFLSRLISFLFLLHRGIPGAVGMQGTTEKGKTLKGHWCGLIGSKFGMDKGGPWGGLIGRKIPIGLSLDILV